jgi:hypothetical protein
VEGKAEESIHEICFCGRSIDCVFACSVLFICGLRVFNNAASKMSTSLLWDVTQRRLIVADVSGQTIR